VFACEWGSRSATQQTSARSVRAVLPWRLFTDPRFISGMRCEIPLQRACFLGRRSLSPQEAVEGGRDAHKDHAPRAGRHGCLARRSFVRDCANNVQAQSSDERRPRDNRVKGAKAGAAGRFSATLNGSSLKWTLTFKNLSGSATAAHIHSARRGVAGPVTVPLCAPCTSPVSGTTVLTPDQMKDLLAGKQYVNVHTAKNPGGEISSSGGSTSTRGWRRGLGW